MTEQELVEQIKAGLAESLRLEQQLVVQFIDTGTLLIALREQKYPGHRDGWGDFCKEAFPDTPYNKIWRMMRVAEHYGAHRDLIAKGSITVSLALLLTQDQYADLKDEIIGRVGSGEAFTNRSQVFPEPKPVPEPEKSPAIINHDDQFTQQLTYLAQTQPETFAAISASDTVYHSAAPEGIPIRRASVTDLILAGREENTERFLQQQAAVTGWKADEERKGKHLATAVGTDLQDAVDRLLSMRGLIPSNRRVIIVVFEQVTDD